MIYINEQDAEVTSFLLIREDDGEWREPLVEEQMGNHCIFCANADNSKINEDKEVHLLCLQEETK